MAKRLDLLSTFQFWHTVDQSLNQRLSDIHND